MMSIYSVSMTTSGFSVAIWRRGHYAKQLAITLAVVAIVAQGCQSVPSLTEGKEYWERRVALRASQRWEALTQRRYADAYAFLSEPSRRGYSLQDFERQMASVDSKAFSLKAVECGPDSCVVRADATVRFAIPRVGKREMPVPTEEVWVLNNSEAYMVRR